MGGPCHEDHNKGRTMRGTKESIRKKKKQNYGHGSKSGYVKGYEAGYDGYEHGYEHGYEKTRCTEF